MYFQSGPDHVFTLLKVWDYYKLYLTSYMTKYCLIHNIERRVVN